MTEHKHSHHKKHSSDSHKNVGTCIMLQTRHRQDMSTYHSISFDTVMDMKSNSKVIKILPTDGGTKFKVKKSGIYRLDLLGYLSVDIPTEKAYSTVQLSFSSQNFEGIQNMVSRTCVVYDIPTDICNTTVLPLEKGDIFEATINSGILYPGCRVIIQLI